jgi:hypothetical protein
MLPVDPLPRACPPIRRLVVVALVAVLALVTGRQLLADEGTEATANPGPVAPAAAGAVDEHVGESLSVVLSAGRRTSEHESLVAVSAPPTNAVPAVELRPWAVPAASEATGQLLWAPLGARAPPLGT